MTRWTANKWLLCMMLVLAGWAALTVSPLTHAQESQKVLEAFEKQAEQQKPDTFAVTTKRKHQILFVMGILLLTGVFTTAGLGIAMGVYG